VHEGVTQDEECLACHHPDNEPEGPSTTHPNFTGCLKCHNDDIE
jgi:predicted CXXCH cytochrome family protein